MAKLPLLTKPASLMDRQIASRCGALQVMKAGQGMSFVIELELDDKIAKEVGKDPLLQQKMADAMEAVYDDLVERVATNLKNTDKGAIQLRDTNQGEKLKKLVEVVNRGIAGARDIAAERAQKDAMKVWAELAKTRKQYANYKMRIVAKIGLATAGLAVSIGMLAGGAVSFGVSSIPGVVAMVKSVAVIGAEIKSASQEIEQAQGRLERKLAAIEKTFVTAKGQFTARGKAQEAGTAIAAQLFGTSGPLAILPSIKDCSGEIGTVKSKLGGLKVNAHDAAQKLNAILKSIEEAKKKFLAEAEKALAKHPSPKAKGDLAVIKSRVTKTVDEQFCEKVEAALMAIISFESRFKSADPKVAYLERRISDLAKLKGLGWRIFENALVLTDVALSFTDPAAVANTYNALTAILPNASALAADRLTKVILEGTVLD